IATVCALVHPDDDPDARTAALLGEVDAFRDSPEKREREAPVDTRIAADPPPEGWKRLVALARRRIGAGEFEKVVLTRRFRLSGPRRFDIPALHAHLAARFPSSFALALGQGADAFVAATPELLVRRAGWRVVSGSLAGSIARGRTPAADRRLAQALVESKKEQGEHAIVLRAIREVLAPRCGELRAPDAPALVRLENVHHLHTPVRGVLRRREHVLSLVEALHPTPAVSGYPREAALAMIREVEGFDRGWYAGPVGWLDAAGDGEFAVAIRSGRIRGREADLFAGAGLVQDSEPRAELQETRAKLRALLDDLLEL
ncbi:MAG: isochorismate synthase MenF, partial [Myxococcota bacterium]